MITVRSWAELRPHRVNRATHRRLVGADSENWDGGGGEIDMAAGMGDVTIDGTEFGGEIMRGHFQVRAST